MAILDEQGWLETPWLEANWLSGGIQDALYVQVEMKPTVDDALGTQTDMKIESPDDDALLGTQVDMSLGDSEALNMEVKVGNVPHHICAGWLVEDWLTTRWLAPVYCAGLRSQVEMRIESEDDDPHLGSQVDMKIASEDDDPHLGSQVEMKVFAEEPLGTQVDMKVFTEKDLLTQVEMKVFAEEIVSTQVEMKVFTEDPLNVQVNRVKAFKLHTQVLQVLYNTTQMRILCDFASRGTPALGGNNWSSIQTLEAGDLGDLTNLNTDVIEQRLQTDTGVIALWQLRCDTGNANTFVDTIGILGHNFTASARVEVLGSDDPSFGTIKFNFVMVTELENMYYIAPSLPSIPARYYEFNIQDPGNADDYLSIGTIVFGSAQILSVKEQFLNPVTFGYRHFKDTLRTEGYTTVSNDRAIRKFLNLTFAQTKLDGTNFRILRDYILTAKTDLKCLIIPRPTKPSRLAVFAKLTQLPEELHTAVDDDNWRVDLTFDWDESL